MGMNPHANGGLLLKPLRIPNFRDYAVKVEQPGKTDAESTRVLGQPAARSDASQHREQELPRGGAGRDRFQPHWRCNHRYREDMGIGRRFPWTRISRLPAA